MLFLGMIDGGNKTLLHSAGQWWEGTLAMRLVSSSLGWSAVWLVRCDGESAGAGGLIDGGNTMFFLGTINGGNTMLLHMADRWWEGGNTGHALGVTDKILTHAEIKHYTYVGIHNEDTLESTAIGTIRYYKT
jgi:hypothetical protein